MAMLRCAACLSLLIGATATVSNVTPMGKVIELITSLHKEVTAEGKTAAASYAKFACWCKDNTKKESKDIQKGNDKISLLSAEIADDSATRKSEEDDNAKRMNKFEEMSQNLQSTVSECKADQAKYEANAADTNKAISSLNGAIKSMKASKNKKSFLQVDAFAQALVKSRVDPNNADFAYHSGDIISLMESLLKDFNSKKADLNSDWKKREAGCKKVKASISKSIEANNNAMKKNSGEIAKLSQEISKDRESLVGAVSALDKDKYLLAEITASCESRAKQFDADSTTRNGELAALSGALKILSGKAKAADAAVNQRAAALVQKKAVPVLAGAVPHSFLQLSSGKFLSRAQSSQQAHDSAIASLRAEGRHLDSLMLMELAQRAGADPFAKLQDLIQGLIQRLLDESEAEASKKGFCDTALGQAEGSRDARWEESNDISAALKRLEAKRDELTEESKRLTQSLKDNAKAAAEATAARNTEKADNAKTIKVANEGLEATAEALKILEDFYSASGGASLLQASHRGKHRRYRQGSPAILGLLETIQSDFDRTIRSTESAEDASSTAFNKLMTSLNVDTAGKETALAMDTQDLQSTNLAIKESNKDLNANMGLLDAALKELEKLRPTCVDTGMSYKDRVAKREAEMKALQKALKLLA